MPDLGGLRAFERGVQAIGRILPGVFADEFSPGNLHGRFVPQFDDDALLKTRRKSERWALIRMSPGFRSFPAERVPSVTNLLLSHDAAPSSEKT